MHTPRTPRVSGSLLRNQRAFIVATAPPGAVPGLGSVTDPEITPCCCSSQALADGLGSHQTGWGQTWDIIAAKTSKYGVQTRSNCSTSGVCKATASTPSNSGSSSATGFRPFLRAIPDHTELSALSLQTRPWLKRRIPEATMVRPVHESME